jgi:Tol biopolymer transport system component
VRRWAFLAALTLGGCDDTVNNDDAFIPFTLRASVGPLGGEGNESAGLGSLSGDGRYVLFYSFATNLHPDDVDGTADVYLKNLSTGSLELVNRATGVAGAKVSGPAGVTRPSFDGSRVAFETFESLDPDDTDSTTDIYLRDLAAGTTTLVSRATGGAKANGITRQADLSADGRYVVFCSTATNLSPDATDGLFQVYLRDLVTGATELVSRATGAAGIRADQFCANPKVSADGGRVAFLTHATNLGVPGTVVQLVYVRDRATNETRLVSRADGPAGAASLSAVLEFCLSDDGRRVGLVTQANNLDPNDAVDNLYDVFVRDYDAETTTHASRADGPAGADAAADCRGVSISGDARYVAFYSAATNLVAHDENGVRDVFVRDLAAGRTFRVSLRTFGAEGTGDSLRTSLSADGRIVAFESLAPQLVDGDGNGKQDVFVRQPLW